MMEFLAMGGHGPFVWGSYGAALLVLVGEMIWLRRRRIALRRQLARLARLQESPPT
ncbi:MULTISPECIES: heme exporter protein CcmD [Ectothiorhodospira]|uniref:heme exporter protein CcmD n=1 Tax=Ectothiorhodospira TaxID=1051 RepID=UPI001EE8354F|nr:MULTISPECIES: heme exporter protein CcmD [Ectothiorhodospira]MCG5493669.1 heme exporter protein CcmD [Ectothiorhodospira variabilis]MCG5502998.1 heme exporter protein CcmD [Ectothiorhodospira variabilis]MCG5506214.1 heme exporter protein CcmD [Ectothiorhodospira variabilis]MCG5525158.1 heme exporter protein CcmD [Ectothiorhodospira haloalkaliphila]